MNMKSIKIPFSCYFFLVVVLSLVCSYNIDTQNSIIYLDTTRYMNWGSRSNISSFFGMSVIIIPGDNTNSAWLQIGAPRGDSPSLLKFKNPGIVFRCPILQPCKYIEVDKEPINRNYIHQLDNAMIGAAMDVNLKYNLTVVCAPRWIHRSSLNSDYRMLGACYWSKLNSEIYHKKVPLEGSSTDYVYKDTRTNESVYNWGQGEAGLSVHMPVDEKEIFVGAPGVFNWKGTTMVFRDRPAEVDNPIASKYRVAGKSNSVEEASNVNFDDVNIGNARLSGNLLSFGLFGYAVTSGYFYSKKQLHYAGGAPRSHDYHGQVFIVHIGENHDQKFNVKDTKEGTQFGEYFGGALAAGDINQDGYDDLFVGAPFRRNTKYNEGRMYLFLGSAKGTLQDPVVGKFIDGTYTYGQFGAAITYLGDMNKDGNRYVAVSAPYAEEGSGIVYIFKGLPQSYGIETAPVQKIFGKHFLPNMRGFGISISRPADLDANGYKDIAVGAYQSGNVVLLRSRPLVVITSYFPKKPTAISTQEKQFSVTLCHGFTSYGGMENIRIRRDVSVDEKFGRAHLLVQKNKELKLTMRKSTCEDIKIGLRESLPNYYDPLTLVVTHHFIEEKPTPSKVLIGNSTVGSDNFCVRCGIYDKFRSIQTVEAIIPFVLECGDDNVCISTLEFNSSFTVLENRTDTFILGSTNVIEIETEVRNTGEKAYQLHLQVDLPKELSFKKRPPLCEQNQTRMICPLANPLGEGRSASLALKLDTDYVNKKIVDDFLYINITVLTNSDNTNEAFKRVKLYLKTEADITISGKSGEQSYIYGNDSNSKVEFQQTYLIGKFGLSPVSLIEFQILVPFANKTDKNSFVSLYQPEGRLEGQPLIIHSDMPILIEHKFDSLEEIGSENIKELRKKRGIENSGLSLKNTKEIEMKVSNLKDETADSDLLGNSTFEISCNSTGIRCGMIHGVAGPFEGPKNSGVIQLRFLLDVKNLTGVLPKNAVIKYSTIGVVTIKDPPNLTQSGTRPDMTVVSSIFLTDNGKKKIDTWIIIVSIVSGLLLLLLLTLGLTKAGFFKRTKKEELEQLKAQTGYEEEVHKNAAANENSEEHNSE